MGFIGIILIILSIYVYYINRKKEKKTIIIISKTGFLLGLIILMLPIVFISIVSFGENSLLGFIIFHISEF